MSDLHLTYIPHQMYIMCPVCVRLCVCVCVCVHLWLCPKSEKRSLFLTDLWGLWVVWVSEWECVKTHCWLTVISAIISRCLFCLMHIILLLLGGGVSFFGDNIPVIVRRWRHALLEIYISPWYKRSLFLTDLWGLCVVWVSLQCGFMAYR